MPDSPATLRTPMDSEQAEFDAFLSFGASQLTSNVNVSGASSAPLTVSHAGHALPTNSHHEADAQDNIQFEGGPNVTGLPLTPNGLGGSWRVKAKWVIIGLSIIILLTGLAVQTVNMSKSWSSVVLPDYIDIGDYTNLTRVVPLPYDVDQLAHKPILDHLNDSERLRSLTRSQASLSLSVKATNRELTKLLVCALKNDPRADSDDKKASFALVNRIILVREQVQYTVSNASGLHDLYTSIKLAYHTYNLTNAKALETTQLDAREDFLICAQPLFRRWMGIDYKKRYWDPWIEKREKLKKERSEMQSGMVTFEKELGRLEEIEQIAQEVDGNLDQFITLIFNDTKVTRNGGNLLQKCYALIIFGREKQSEEKAQKDWIQQHIARYNLQDEEPLTNSHFDAWWINLDCRHYA